MTAINSTDNAVPEADVRAAVAAPPQGSDHDAQDKLRAGTDRNAVSSRHWNSDQGALHPIIQAQFNAVPTSGGIVDLPPVTVRGDQVSGEHAADYAMFFTSPPLLPPDVDSIDPEGWLPLLDPALKLSTYAAFTQLPERLQELVLASPTMTAQMIRFFEAGGRIEFVPGLGNFGGKYLPEDNVIQLDESITTAMDPAADNYDYLNGVWISTLAHEVGHWSVGIDVWDGGSLPDYIDHRAVAEAMATVNSMVVAAEIEYLTDFNVTIAGYVSEAQLGPLYETFQNNHDLDALVDAVADLTKTSDGFINSVTEFWEEHYGP